MNLPTHIKFAQQLSSLPGTLKSFTSGVLQGTPRPEANFLYEIVPPLVVVNNVPVLLPGFVLGFSSFNLISVQPGDTVFSNVPWRLAGSLKVSQEQGWIPFAIGGAAGETVALPDGFEEAILYFASQEVFGVNEMAGKLGKFTYTNDGNVSYVIAMDQTNGAAVQNPAAAADAIVNSPKALKFRYILCQQNDDKTVKRKITICNGNNPKYLTGGTISLETVNGAKDFKITGRVGEKYSF